MVQVKCIFVSLYYLFGFYSVIIYIMRKIQLQKIIYSLALTSSVAVVGSLFTVPNITVWYNTLEKPSFTPPSWLFGPVWTGLYFMIAISFAAVWSQKETKESKKGKAFFLIQLFLNLLWSAVFFGLHSPVLGLIEIVVLFVFAVLTLKYFLKTSRSAGIIFLPYIIWISFAILLNASIVFLNF